MDDNIIETHGGKLRGATEKTKNGFKYQSFKGIPYGKPPIGPLRFKDPQKIEAWEGIKDATIEGGICPQLEKQSEKIIGDENCLFLNVYKPHSKTQENTFPVMVWFHGGGFYKGSGNYDTHGPDFLIEKNIIYVSVNYRFGIFGFLCLHNKDVPGNAGLKDQILALRWVKDNISKFGGDPNNITIFGESAGAASISFLTLSPSARELFHKVIIQSGTSLCSWSIQHDPIKYAQKIAENLNASEREKSDFDNMLNFLQKIPFDQLLEKSSRILTAEDSKKYLPIAYLPVVEKVYAEVESVINKPPEEIFKSGMFPSLPTIAGYSSKEGLFMFEKIGCDLNKVGHLIGNLENFLPPHITNDKNLLNKYVDKLNELYFDKKPIDNLQTNNVIDFLSDFLFRHPVDRNIHFLRKYSSAPIYYFQFSYQGNLSRDKKIFKNLKLDGASHSEECGYIFRKQYLDGEMVLPEDALTRQRFIEMWINFAKFGNPTPEINEVIPVIWKPVTKTDLNYLDIGKDLKTGTDPNNSTLFLWNEIRETDS